MTAKRAGEHFFFLSSYQSTTSCPHWNLFCVNLWFHTAGLDRACQTRLWFITPPHPPTKKKPTESIFASFCKHVICQLACVLFCDKRIDFALTGPSFGPFVAAEGSTWGHTSDDLGHRSPMSLFVALWTYMDSTSPQESGSPRHTDLK